MATGSGGGSTTHRLWVDKIGVELAFDPAPTLTDAERRDAFRSYVHLRYQSKHGGSFQSTDWKVQVARPYNNPAPGTPTKKFTIQNSGATLYAVEQPDLESFEVAWVYVAGTHEIWVHYLPGEPDGFCFPGTTDPRTSSTLSNTELRFSFVDDQVRDLGNYLQAINALKTTIIEERHQLNPATANYDDYVVHDFRVEGQ